MKRCLLFISFVFCLLIGCNQKLLKEENLIYYKYSYSQPLELWVGENKIDFGNIQVNDILFDTYTNQIYVISKEKSNHIVKIYKFQNPQNNKFDYLEVPLQSEYFEIFVCKNEFLFYMGNNKYILFNSLTNKLQEHKLPSRVNHYSISGFDLDNIYFDNGYYSLEKDNFSFYPSEINFYRNRIFPKEQKIVFINSKNKKICLFDLSSKRIETLFIKGNYNYSSRSMYFLDGNYLFFSKYSKSLKNLFSNFFPGSNKNLEWFKYNLKTGEITKVFQKNNGVYVIVGVMK